MGKYSLVVTNNKDKSSHNISVYDLEKKEYKEKVHIKDIDAFTSKFNGDFDFIKYLNEENIINFSDASFHIISKYKETDFRFKVIFNSEMINNTAKKVKAGYIDSTKEGYNDIKGYFYNNIRENNFIESIKNTSYITTSFKNIIIRYVELVNKEKDREEQLNEERILKWQIDEELKRYKTFRGFHLFIEQYKKYGYVKAPVKKYDNYYLEQYNDDVKVVNKSTKEPKVELEEESTTKIISNVDDYNKEYDEFLSEEEYADAYGDEGMRKRW